MIYDRCESHPTVRGYAGTESGAASAAAVVGSPAIGKKAPKEKRAPGVTAEQEYKAAKAAAKALRKRQWEKQQAREVGQDGAARAVGGGAASPSGEGSPS